MHRFFINPTSLKADQVTLTKEQARQIKQVLRLKSQDRILVLDDTGREYEVVLEEVDRERVSGHIVETRDSQGEPAVSLTLYQSLVSREKFEWVLQKGTEVGIRRFVPVHTQRSIVRSAAGLTPQRRQRWQRILKEAAEQCARGRIPELKEPMTFTACLKDLSSYDRVFLTGPGDSGSTLASCLDQPQDKIRSVALFIGPEGGFSDEEVTQARASGVTVVGLGPRILRTETAGIVGATLVLYELGEYGV
jgi:16S rRNA (uracil1498-N3)-methyltransferase